MRRLLALLTLACLLSGCETVPLDAFRPSASTLALRSMQTREYRSVSDAEILSASSAVLQDMGYAVDEIEVSLGVISASKRADASSTLELFGAVFRDGVKCIVTLALACDGRNYGKAGDVQDIRMTVISRPTLENANDVTVRVTIQQIIWDKKGRVSSRLTINDSDVYASLFEKMSKAVFLEQEGL